MSEHPWEITYAGNIIAVETHKIKGFERAIRSPGVRLILQNPENEVLLTKEFRQELGDFDYRLPGGKVYDALLDYLAVRGDQTNIDEAVLRAGRDEAKQEAGIESITDLSIYHRSVAGATIEWDLFYLTGSVTSLGAQDLEGDELLHGIDVGFYPKAEVLRLLGSGEFHEDRSAGVLFRYLSIRE